MLFHLRFDFGESSFAYGAKMFIIGRSVQRTCGQREIQRKSVFLGAGNFAKYGVELDQIRLITFQKRIQFAHRAFKLLIDRIVTLDIFETDGEFHMRTCRICERQARQAFACEPMGETRTVV